MTMRNANGMVKVMLPPGMACSHVIVNGRTYMVEAGGAAWMPPTDALDMLDSAEPSALPWRQANQSLLAALQANAQQEGYVPAHRRPGVRISDMLAAVADSQPSLNAELRRFAAARNAGLRELLGRPR